jgi:arylsulfatase A-like enzyme
VYAALIETLDDTIGVLMEKLEELHLTENTIFIFTSDNGGLHVPELCHEKVTHNTPYRASVVEGKVKSTVPRTENAAADIGKWNVCQPPTEGYVEQCFFHDVEAGADGMARMTLRNPVSGMAVAVAYRKAELPYFTQWKMMGRQEYVMGLEPANCHPGGQAAEKQSGILKMIEPGEMVQFKTTIILHGK